MLFSDMHVGYGAWLLVLLCLPAPIQADSLSEDRVKAGFIFSFIKFTDWPASALAGTHIRVCSPERQPLSGELFQLQGRQAQGREIEVHAPVRQEDWRTCHVLFIAASDRKVMGAAFDAMVRTPVLTVSDSADFVASGGMVALKKIAGRIRFEVNLGSARRAGLGLSSKLLQLAEAVWQ